MKRVAVLAFKQKDMSFNYGDDIETLNLPVHCTEWTEISDSELKELNLAIDYLNKHNSYKHDYLRHVVILQPKIENDFDQKSYILEKVSDYKNFLKKEKEREEKIKKIEEEKKIEKKKKKEERELLKKAKTLEEKKALFEKLFN